ncbi:ras-related protein Rab-34 isoform X1 [Ursus maritimus]|uniref:Ras-related protein Rab-34 n=1 Tax=Ursus maritimus TaxID=29073 RepID=A0A384CFB6_URSMA|nr:ras-related protein Rab-34 isoform X1 [Ursus maritimus]
MESENAGPRAESPGPRAAIYPKGEVSGPPSPSLDSIEGRRLVFSLPPLSLHRSLEGKHPRLWTSLSSVGIPCLLPPPHPIPGRRASGGRLYESRPGPGVEEGSAASPWAPSLLLPAPRRLLAQPDTAQQSRILHHQFDWCLRKEAALHVHKDFHPRVTCACQEHRTGTVGFKISKVIVVGDLSVGKTCLINRFCKDTFDKNYKATIGVDFEMERFEVLGVPFSLQLWDTAGQERFKCIASTYYRGAQAIIIVFNLNDVASLEHTRQWLADALKENDPANVLLFLVGSKKDLSTPAQYVLMEKDALKVAQELKAEYWAVSSLTGENVREFFFRVAALTFEANVLAELEKSGARRIGDVVRIHSDDSNLYLTASKKKPTCCP